MSGVLADLGGQLLACAEAQLLDAPLDQLGGQCSEDQAAELLLALHAAGDAETLREALGAGVLVRFAEQTCTPREEEALQAQLRQWLGMGQRGSDDPPRLVQVSLPPAERSGLRTWAEEQGLHALLAAPARALLQDARADPGATLEDACLGRGSQGTGHLLDQARLSERARRHLQALAAERSAETARAALWQHMPPEGQLRVLGERLWACCIEPGVGSRQESVTATIRALHDVRFVPARPIELDPRSGVTRAQVWDARAPEPLAVRLYLSGYEQRGLQGSCSRCGETRCLHLRALAGRLLDACLAPGDRLHAALLALARVPSWQRFLSALDAPQPPAHAPPSRLCFVLRLQNGLASVGALLQKPTADGLWTQGKLSAPKQLLRTSSWSDQDRPVLELMAAQQRTLIAAYTPADVSLLRSLIEHPHTRLEGSSHLLRVREETFEVSLHEQPDGLLPRVLLAGQEVKTSPSSQATYLLRHDAESGSLVFSPLSPALRRLLAALADFRGVLPKESHAGLAQALTRLKASAQVHIPPVLLGAERPPPERLLLRITPGLDQGIDVALSVRALPLGPLWPPGQGAELAYGFVDGEQIFTRRDLQWERRQAEQVIETLELSHHLRLDPFRFRIDTDQAALEVLSRAARLANGLELEWAERTRKLTLVDSIHVHSLKIGLFKRGDFLTLEGHARSGDTLVAVSKLLEAVRRGERFVPIGGESYAEIEAALFARLREAQTCLLELSSRARVPLAAAPFLLDLLGHQAEAHDDPSDDWLGRVREPASPSLLSAHFRGRLRDYQQQGAAWMLAQSRWARGVCLADEMGLGKTVQTLAVLSERAPQGPALVVAPTSLVQNWLDELPRFAPQLRGLGYRGAKRRRLLDGLEAGQVLITSYDVLLRDRSLFRDLVFATQVIDEAQVVKNARTLRAQAVASVQARFRIALSGTPVENRLGDLWSLFRLLEPDLLGSWARFRARFAVPIERYENQERAATLRTLVSPFILRRTKEQVETQLPARTEVIHLIALSQAEQNLYQAAVHRARLALGKRKHVQEPGTVYLLSELTRLRQLACHPRLVLKDPRAESSKLHALLRLLEDILPRGHRALVFSQFTEHLALVREALDQRGLRYLYLDGSTPEAARAALVSRFQAGEAPLFLISLKAGGTGLNLTAADYVLHLDPWWNPAAEDQAGGRAHRLGQQRPVTIVKLVSQGTIEERVLGLHAHKRRLAQAVLGGEPSAPELDHQALEALLG